MAIRDAVRGTPDWETLERVFAEFADRHGRESVRVRFLDADNWLSVPCVVDEEFFVKVIAPRNALVHAAFTAGRNLGAISSGRGGFFGRFADPGEMARHELEATRRIAEAGIEVPAPVEAFEVDGHGVLVLEYLDDVRPLGEATPAERESLAADLFDRLRRLHDHGLAHGDLRAENVLLCSDGLYLIDATRVTGAGDSATGDDPEAGDSATGDPAATGDGTAADGGDGGVADPDPDRRPVAADDRGDRDRDTADRTPGSRPGGDPETPPDADRSPANAGPAMGTGDDGAAVDPEVRFRPDVAATDRFADARAYDVASALATLSPIVGPREAVLAARDAYDPGELLAAREFLDFVALRPDHDFDAARLKGEIERVAG